MPYLANLYVLNTVFQTNNVNLLLDYNNPTGPYQFNILNQVYTNVLSSFGYTTPGLLIYPFYAQGASSGPTSYTIPYKPNSEYLGINPLYSYNPESKWIYNPPTNTNFWYEHVFYDFNNYYTGTYSSGYFIGTLRPSNYTGTSFSLSSTMYFSNTKQRKEIFNKLTDINLKTEGLNQTQKTEYYIKNFKVAPSTSLNQSQVIKVSAVGTQKTSSNTGSSASTQNQTLVVNGISQPISSSATSANLSVVKSSTIQATLIGPKVAGS